MKSNTIENYTFEEEVRIEFAFYHDFLYNFYCNVSKHPIYDAARYKIRVLN